MTNKSKLEYKLLEIDKYDSIIKSLLNDLDSVYEYLKFNIGDKNESVPLTVSDILYVIECKRMELMKEIYLLNKKGE